jgi:hypothetical protein
MDMTESIAPKSDQLNAEDLLTGPRTFTIESVSPGSAEQPVDFHLIEYPGRAYRPSKSMRRVIVNAWGADTTAYTGRRLTLYRDPEITFGREKVGGIKISHLSNIDKRISVALTVTRGKRSQFTVDPLPDAPTQPTAEQVAACTDLDVLRGWWKHTTLRQQIQARIDTLNTPAAVPADDDRSDEYLALMADEA